VKCVVDEVAMGQGFIQVLRFTADRIIPLMLHTHSSATDATQWQQLTVLVKITKKILSQI